LGKYLFIFHFFQSFDKWSSGILLASFLRSERGAARILFLILVPQREAKGRRLDLSPLASGR
jgi:hypothetical protein